LLKQESIVPYSRGFSPLKIAPAQCIFTYSDFSPTEIAIYSQITQIQLADLDDDAMPYNSCPIIFGDACGCYVPFVFQCVNWRNCLPSNRLCPPFRGNLNRRILSVGQRKNLSADFPC